MKIKRLLRKNPEIIILITLGLTPLLWLKQGYIIANGDDFPFWFIPQRTLENDFHLWSSHNVGDASVASSYMIYEGIWLALRSLGISIETIQILFHVFLFMGSGFFMYQLSKIIYPDKRLAHLASGVFYMFNLFVLQTRHNIGLMWTYCFLPLLISQLIKIVDIKNRQKTSVKKYSIYFAITSTITLSFACVNPANLFIIVFVLSIFLFYYFLAQKKQLRLCISNIVKLAVLCILTNMWWMISFLNYFIWTPSALNPQMNVASWSWTHNRASFLNLFWLNGLWGWRPEYFPYYDSYSNPIIIIFIFLPFLFATTALLFKTRKSHFNNYLMFSILILLFLAKGIHWPFSQINLIFYTYIPGMEMFREPTSKFTMALMPLLALLIGYAVGHSTNIRIRKVGSTYFTHALIPAFLITTSIVTAYPLLTNPIETKTPQLPFSSYVKIPEYWYQATEWLNNQHDNYKILITPPDDFYQMPYTWGYYGTDQFLERLLQRPIISNHYVYSYKTSSNITLTLHQLSNTIKYNRTDEFKAFLDLLNIRYILQRNDIQHNFTGRNIISPNEMEAFLAHQPYISLTQKFGQLDIYEYDEQKAYFYVLSPRTFNQTTIEIENITLLHQSWNFTSLTEMYEWNNATQPNQWQVNYTITQDENTLKAELWNSTWGWKMINSPLFPAKYGDMYQIQADIKSQNAHQIHLKMAEYDINQKILISKYLEFVNDGTFNWTPTIFNFEPTNKTTKYLQIQVWHGHETDKPFPNIIWIDNVKIHGYTTQLNTTNLNLIFPNTTHNQLATILDYQKINPTKITATINATEPFILAVSEALDHPWKAYVNGKQIESSPLYLELKGFHINQTGVLEVNIEYEPQKWFFYGSTISATTLLACLTYLTFNWIKDKAIWKQIETTLKNYCPVGIMRHLIRWMRTPTKRFRHQRKGPTKPYKK